MLEYITEVRDNADNYKPGKLTDNFVRRYLVKDHDGDSTIIPGHVIPAVKLLDSIGYIPLIIHTSKPHNTPTAGKYVLIWPNVEMGSLIMMAKDEDLYSHIKREEVVK